MHDFWTRLSFAFRTLFAILLHDQIPEDVARELVGAVGAPAASGTAAQPLGTKPAAQTVFAAARAEPVPESIDGAVQILTLLQRDGRLVDFLREDIGPYPDDQLGAAVRNIHQTCRQVLEQYFKFEPIIDSAEDQPVTLQADFDTSAVKLLGNADGQPPVKGVLRHRGWRVSEVKLPTLPQGSGRRVVAPAEVEVS
jgi:hypothetical protein